MGRGGAPRPRDGHADPHASRRARCRSARTATAAYAGHDGLDDVLRRFGAAIFERSTPRSGAATQALDRGWHAGTWFRLKDTSYDRLMERLAWIGEHVKIRLR